MRFLRMPSSPTHWVEHIKNVMSHPRPGFSGWMSQTFLWWLSQPYGMVVALRNWAYDRRWLSVTQVAVPVISVGNLTVGGTGKTPAVMWIARWFREKDIRVSILSRGYGAGEADVNDEAKEMELRLPDVPHLQNPDRIASAQVATEELETQLIVLDDAFQHRKLHRDLNIVLIDALLPFGYEHLLPRGLLREPIRSLRRVDVVLVTRADQVDSQSLARIRNRVQLYAPKAAWVETEHRPVHLVNRSGETKPLEWIAGKKVFAFCGLGNPTGFFETLRGLEAQILERHAFPDHHPYRAEDLTQLRERAESLSGLDVLICTGKDASKIGVDRLGRIPLWSLQIELNIRSGREALEDRLQEIVQSIMQKDSAHDAWGPTTSP